MFLLVFVCRWTLAIFMTTSCVHHALVPNPLSLSKIDSTTSIWPCVTWPTILYTLFVSRYAYTQTARLTLNPQNHVLTPTSGRPLARSTPLHIMFCTRSRCVPPMGSPTQPLVAISLVYCERMVLYLASCDAMTPLTTVPIINAFNVIHSIG